MVPKAQLFKASAKVLQLISDRAPPTARHSSEGSQTLHLRCGRYTRNGELRWCLNNSTSLSVGLSILDEAMGFAYCRGLASMQTLYKLAL